MSNSNKISIIMPAYNTEKYVSDAIESVLNQTYENWELLAIDDGSTDSTGDIIASYAEKDERIRAFHTENKGVSHARNIGLDNASGEWIAFLDSDDMYYEDAMSALLDNSNASDLIIGDFETYPVNYRHYRIEERHEYNGFRELKPDFIELLNEGFFSVVWGKLFKKDIICGRFSERLENGEDTLFFASQIGQFQKITTVSHTVYRYRMTGDGSLSKKYTGTAMNTIETVIKTYISYFNNPEITSQIYTYYLHSLINTLNSLFRCPDLSDNERKSTVLYLIDNDLFHSIPVGRYPFHPATQRKIIALQIGDIDMIVKEFNEGK